MPSGLVDRWRSRFGITIRQLYGLSEAGVIAIEPADTRVSILQPVQGVEVAILTNDGLRSDSGESGEVAVRSKGLMSGYLAEPELTQERFQDGFFRTGDLGCLDENGNLHVIGRISRLLNIAGVKVDPVEVERAIEMIESVASCHVDTVPNAAGGDVIRARVVTRPGLNVTRREVIEQCRRQLAEYKIPRAIEFVDESAVSLAGKMPHIASAAQGSS
jgi:acyl-CoA synthetase (AMP-forming)/AMP-acid ligase II